MGHVYEPFWFGGAAFSSCDIGHFVETVSSFVWQLFRGGIFVLNLGLCGILVASSKELGIFISNW